MSFSFQNLPISVKIAALAFIPMMALLFEGAKELVAKRELAAEARAVAEVVDMAPVVSGLVHELQKERGTSAGFIGSKGSRFADDIGGRRADTDAALDAFLKAIPAATGRLDFPGFKEPYDVARAELEKLQTVRKEIDGFERTVPQMAGYYTPLIAKLLASVESVALITDNGKVVRSLTAYVAFLQAKERAGIERAMGATGFGANKFAEPVYRNFVGLGAMQVAFGTIFERFGNADTIAAWQAVQQSEEQKVVDRMREVAFKNPFGGNMRTVSGPAWFVASTKRIDQMKEVENQIADGILADASQIASDTNRAFWTLLSLLAVLFVFIAFLAFVVARSVTKPLYELIGNMNQLAKNNTNIEIHGLHRKDEIGQMARSVDVFLENAVERLRLENNTKAERERELDRQSHLDQMIEKFRGLIDATLRNVDSQTSAMKNSSATLSDAAIAASSEANSAEKASEGASGNVQAVAIATEQLVTAVREISNQAVQANQMVGSATGIATSTNKEVASLSEAAERIGTVVGIIRDIADQTNLLALNATIEAARAGEMGKGFAVVASEVKELASQTSKATEEISTQIAGVQALTENAVAAIGRISSTVEEINIVTTTIASAVEEQEASTQEIAGSIRLAASDTQNAMGNAQEVSKTIRRTTDEAKSVEDVSTELSAVASQLAQEVEAFLMDVSKDVDERREMLRDKMHQVVLIRDNGRRLATKMIQPTVEGFTVMGASALAVGEGVLVQLCNGETVPARVTAHKGEAVSLDFISTLSSVAWLGVG